MWSTMVREELLKPLKKSLTLSQVSSRQISSFKHYAATRILNLDLRASKKDIKAAYLKLSKTYHPDNADTGDNEKFLKIKEAYESIMGDVAEELEKVGSETNAPFEPAPDLSHKAFMRERDFLGDYYREEKNDGYFDKRKPYKEPKF